MNDNEQPVKIIKLYGVYDADATILGELSYWFGARLGVRHCSLCDITHSLFRQRAEWQKRQQGLKENYGVDFQAYHRNNQPAEVRKVIDGNYPAVVAQDELGNFRLFMSDAEVARCDGSPELFMAEIINRLP